MSACFHSTFFWFLLVSFVFFVLEWSKSAWSNGGAERRIGEGKCGRTVNSEGAFMNWAGGAERSVGISCSRTEDDRIAASSWVFYLSFSFLLFGLVSRVWDVSLCASDFVSLLGQVAGPVPSGPVRSGVRDRLTLLNLTKLNRLLSLPIGHKFLQLGVHLRPGKDS